MSDFTTDKRPLNRAIQLTLSLPCTHGGRRKGSGRPNRSGLQAHVKRPRLSGQTPLHVTLRLRAGLPSLRRKDVFRELRIAADTARKKGFGVVHFAILSNHLHFILEAGSAPELGRRMQSFSIALAKRINRLAGRKGTVFTERYHSRSLTTPTEVRKAVAYVLGNEGKHRGEAQTVYVGPFSSVAALPKANDLTKLRAIFGGKVRLVESVRASPSARAFGLGDPGKFRTWARGSQPLAEDLRSLLLREPQSWLLRVGWARG